MNEMNYLDEFFKKTDFTAILVRWELSNLPAGGNTHAFRIEDKERGG